MRVEYWNRDTLISTDDLTVNEIKEELVRAKSQSKYALKHSNKEYCVYAVDGDVLKILPGGLLLDEWELDEYSDICDGKIMVAKRY